MTVRDATYTAVEATLNLDIENVLWVCGIIAFLCLLSWKPAR